MVLDDTIYFATGDVDSSANDESVYFYKVIHQSWNRCFLLPVLVVSIFILLLNPVVPIGNMLFEDFHFPIMTSILLLLHLPILIDVAASLIFLY